MDNQIFTKKSDSFEPAIKKAFPFIKIIFIIFILAIAVEVVVGLKTLLTPVKLAPKSQPVTNVISDGSITLDSSQTTYQTGAVIPITVKVATGGHLTAGVDLVLKYDPQKLSASPSSFIKGASYDDYPPINLEKPGFLRISGVVSTNNPGFEGIGEFGTINFVAKAKGVVEVSLDFAPDLTSDSNMVEVGTNKDILGQVSGVKINIQ